MKAPFAFLRLFNDLRRVAAHEVALAASGSSIVNVLPFLGAVL